MDPIHFQSCKFFTYSLFGHIPANIGLWSGSPQFQYSACYQTALKSCNWYRVLGIVHIRVIQWTEKNTKASIFLLLTPKSIMYHKDGVCIQGCCQQRAGGSDRTNACGWQVRGKHVYTHSHAIELHRAHTPTCAVLCQKTSKKNRTSFSNRCLYIYHQ